MKALGETTVVLCSGFVQTLLHAIRGKGIALRVREIHVENYSDFQALQEVKCLMLGSFSAVFQPLAFIRDLFLVRFDFDPILLSDHAFFEEHIFDLGESRHLETDEK